MQHLEGDIALEPVITGSPDLAHPAGPCQGHYAIRAEDLTFTEDHSRQRLWHLQPFGILPCSRHLPVAVTDGSTTRKGNKTGVRLWTDSSLVKTPVEVSRSWWTCPPIISVPVGEITLESGAEGCRRGTRAS